MKKPTRVKLATKERERDFEIGHAQTLLDYEKEKNLSNWSLADGRFTLNNGIIERTNIKATKDSGKSGKTD